MKINSVTDINGTVIPFAENVKTEQSDFSDYLSQAQEQTKTVSLDDIFERFIIDRAIKLLDAIESVTGKKITDRTSEEVVNYFGEELNDGIIQIPVGDTTKDVSEFKNLYTTAQFMATIMNDGQTPVVYKLNSDNFIKSEFTEQDIIIAKVALVVILVLVTVIFSIKFKLNGLLAGIANIGFVALTSLILRYTKVTITINSVISFVTMIILNIVFMKMLLKALMEKSSSEALNKTMIKYYLSIIDRKSVV